MFFMSQINLWLPYVLQKFSTVLCHCHILLLEIVCGSACVRVGMHVYIGVFAHCLHIYKYNFLGKV